MIILRSSGYGPCSTVDILHLPALRARASALPEVDTLVAELADTLHITVEQANDSMFAPMSGLNRCKQT